MLITKPDDERLRWAELDLQQNRFVMDSLEKVEVTNSDLFDKIIPQALTGIYVFLSGFCRVLRLYIGESERLSERIHEQLSFRKWANKVIIFELQGLKRTTLKSIESQLLLLLSHRYPLIHWDNEKGIPGHETNNLRHTSLWYPQLDELVERIVHEIECQIPSKRLEFQPADLLATHELGHPAGKARGIAHLSGRWLTLLKGSRISSDYPNFRTIQKCQHANRALSKRYHEGQISWHSGWMARPAGMVVGEPIRFCSLAEAAAFLHAGEKPTSRWLRIQ